MTISSSRQSSAPMSMTVWTWLLTSEWNDDDYTNFQSSKINIHPHFFQFDTGNSDGVISGFEYEMSVRPFTMWGKAKKHGLPAPMVAKIVGGAKAGSEFHQDPNGARCHAVPCEHRSHGRRGLFGKG